LDVLAESTEDLSWAQMEGRLNFDKSTYYRLLRTLEHHRYAERDSQTGKYRLGSKLLELGSKAVARFDLATACRPYLERLSGQSGETALLGVFRDGQVITLTVVEGRHALRMGVTVGGKAAVHCSAIGKAILAFLPEDEAGSIVRNSSLTRYTRHTITRRSEFKAELAQIRNRGFAMDNQELEVGLKCIGAAVQDRSGRVIAALSIAGAALRFNRIPYRSGITTIPATLLIRGFSDPVRDVAQSGGAPAFRSESEDLYQRLAIRIALVAAPSRRLSPITVMQMVLPSLSRSS
jgi:DNA-binding IclR family transcriptional regulator